MVRESKESTGCTSCMLPQAWAHHIIEAIVNEDISTEGVLLHIAPGDPDRHPQLDVANLSTGTHQSWQQVASPPWRPGGGGGGGGGG